MEGILKEIRQIVQNTCRVSIKLLYFSQKGSVRKHGRTKKMTSKSEHGGTPQKRNKKWLHMESIRTRMFLGMTGLILLLVFLIDGLVYRCYKTDMEEQTISYATDTISKIAENMTDTVAALEENMTYKINYADIFGYQENLKNAEAFSIEQDMATFAEMMKSDAFQIDTVYVRDKYNCRFYWNKDTPSHENLREFKKTEAGEYIETHYGELESRRGKTIWRRFSDAPGKIFLIKNVLDWDTLEFQGILCAAIDDGYMAEAEKNLGFHIAVYDETGMLLYSTEELSEKAVQYEQAAQEESFEKEDEEYLTVYAALKKRGWSMVGFISKTELQSGMWSMLRQLFLLETGFMVLGAVVSAWLSKNMTSNISALIANFRRIRQGEEAEDIQYKAGDETAYLCQKFNDMNHQLKDAVTQMAENRTQKERAEYNALTAQMNPHFLYNTLESINALAKLHEEQEISGAVTGLARLMRASLSGKELEIPLRQELEYAEQYLKLQHLITGRLEWDISADEKLMECLVPKLILQPLMENAIIHGFSDMQEIPMLAIIVKKEKGKMAAEICDNGCGMELNTARRLMEENGPEPQDSGRAHIGISSIRRRIRYLYGEDYGLTVIANTEEGTVIRLTLPIREGKTREKL